MNVAVFGRVQPPLGGQPAPSLNIIDENTLSSSQQQGAVSHRFQTLYDHNSSNSALYHGTIQPMVEHLVAGFNCSLVCFGESGSGKTYTLTGEDTNDETTGVVQMTIKDLFDKSSTGYGGSSSIAFTNYLIDLSMYELYNETIRDLLKQVGQGISQNAEGNLNLDISAEQGLYVKNLNSIRVTSEAHAMSTLKKGLSSRNTSQTDYGPAQMRTSVFIKVTLTLERHQDPGYPHQSTFKFIDMPSADKLMEDPQKLRKKEGPLLNKSLLSFEPLLEQLASKRGSANRVIDYGDSQLNLQLSDIFGGNCRTQVLMHFKPQSATNMLDVMLSMARLMSQVVNYPVANDAIMQGLVTQYRAKLLYLKTQLGQNNVANANLTADELQESHTQLARENLKLKEEKRYLQRKLEQLQGRMEDNAGAKYDLSSKLIASEEEKLKASKALVDLKIENTKLKEKTEQQAFELNNKLMSVDNDLSQVEMERMRLAKENRQMRQKLGFLETDQRDVADKYVQLNTDYRALVRKYDQEVNRSQELGLELLNLLQARITLQKQQDNLDRANTLHKPSNEELGRAKDIARGMSTSKIKAEEIGSSKMDRIDLENKIFGNRDRFKMDIDALRNQYDEQQETLKARINDLTSSVKSSMETARDAQHKLAEQQVEVIMLRDKTKSLQTLNGKLQLQVKDKNEELRSKLTKYLQDISEYVDDRTRTLNRPVEQQLTDYVKEMVQDLKKTYVGREKQLSEAVREYRSQAQRVANKHEQLMVAYRMLRMQQGQRSPEGNNLSASDEFKFSLSDEELESSNRQELSRLNKDIQEAQEQLKKLKLPGSMSMATDGWKALEKQLQQFTKNTQEELESERATLMSSNAILEEQLIECRRYIDTQLKEYKDEIYRLRKKLGVNPTDGYLDPTTHKRDLHYRGRPHKTTYY